MRIERPQGFKVDLTGSVRIADIDVDIAQTQGFPHLPFCNRKTARDQINACTILIAHRGKRLIAIQRIHRQLQRILRIAHGGQRNLVAGHLPTGHFHGFPEAFGGFIFRQCLERGQTAATANNAVSAILKLLHHERLQQAAQGDIGRQRCDRRRRIGRNTAGPHVARMQGQLVQGNPAIAQQGVHILGGHRVSPFCVSRSPIGITKTKSPALFFREPGATVVGKR